MTTEQVK